MAGVFFPAIGSLSKAQASCIKIILIFLLTFTTSQAADKFDLEDIYKDPCSSMRHVRSATENETNFFIKVLNKTYHKLSNLYPRNQEQVQIRGNCPRIDRLIKPINRTRNITTAYLRYHQSMLQLLVFLRQLRDIKIHADADFNREERQKIFDETDSHLRLTLCESSEDLKKLYQFSFKSDDLYSSIVKKVNRKCLPKEADLSSISQLDRQFFKKLQKFFKKVKKIMQNFKPKGRIMPKHKRNKQNQNVPNIMGNPKNNKKSQNKKNSVQKGLKKKLENKS